MREYEFEFLDETKAGQKDVTFSLTIWKDKKSVPDGRVVVLVPWSRDPDTPAITLCLEKLFDQFKIERTQLKIPTGMGFDFWNKLLAGSELTE